MLISIYYEYNHLVSIFFFVVFANKLQTSLLPCRDQRFYFVTHPPLSASILVFGLISGVANKSSIILDFFLDFYSIISDNYFSEKQVNKLSFKE